MPPMRTLLLLVPLAACGGGDDFARPGTWRPTGVNDANLRVMLADPAEASRGTAALSERAQPGSLAVSRLLRDRRRSLPDSRAAQIGAPPPSTAESGGPGPADAR